MIDPNKNNILFFDTDDDFYNFCVDPCIVPVKDTLPDGTENYYTTFNFTNDYNDAVAQGKTFIIKNENSQIFKRGCVSCGFHTKKVKNLEPYYPELYDECCDDCNVD